MPGPKPDELVQIDYAPPTQGWMESGASFRPGTYSHAAHAKSINYMGLPNPREWRPADQDWKLPAGWQNIILEGIKERLEKYRSFRLFMDLCVRCGACAD